MIINLHFCPNFRSASITFKEPVLMEAVAVLIMLSHHLQGFYVISIISKCKIAMDSHLVYWHFMLLSIPSDSAGRVTAKVCGANYCGPVAVVPSPTSTRTTTSILYEQCVLFFNVPRMCKGRETGTSVCRPYPRRLESLIICKCTFSNQQPFSR